jgi:hypothetical protein
MLGAPPWHCIKKNYTDPKKGIECPAPGGCTNRACRKVRPPASCPSPQGAGDMCKSEDKPEDLHLA